MTQRVHPRVAVRRIVRNQSSRAGARPLLIVVHSTESDQQPDSSRDLGGVGSWFDNPATQCSSHVCVDADSQSARFVADERKAWHCAGYNSVSLGLEQIGRAAQGAWRRDELREAARWVARWSIRWGIPIRKGAVADGRVLRSGILRHSELGAYGGGHHDPGRPYPLHDMLSLARFYRGKLLN